MGKVAQTVSKAGCLISLLAPLVGLVLYPRGKWLFGFVLLGFALLVLAGRLHRGPTPLALADDAERLLTGFHGAWDVDDYEHCNPRDPRLRELWLKTMQVGGLPEEWAGLDEWKKDALWEIIRSIRELGSDKQL